MEEINQILIESTLRKTINDIKDSPKRSIRNLVDLGVNFTSGGFEKPFFESIQKLLKNEHSPYYDLILDTVYNVSTERLINFGMNVGFNSCIKGSKIIRKIEEREKYNIPWCVTLEIDGKGFPENEAKYFNVIEQGRTMGIFTWLIFSDRNLKSVFSLVEKNTDCAFVFFCDEADINNAVLDEAENLNNIMFAVRCNEDMSCSLAILRKKQMLYSVYFPYTENEINRITNGSLYEGIEDLHPIFTVLLPVEQFSHGSREKVRDFVTNIRSNQDFQTVLWDVYSDCKLVDSVISNDSCFAAFDKKGFLHSESGNKDESYNIFTMPLTQIFKMSFSKC